MPVKRSQSGTCVLKVLEAIAEQQPIGIRGLARLMEKDKSAIQRAVMTLADAGWLRASSNPSGRWELTSHLSALASKAQGSLDLRQRARPYLESLRDQTGETILLVLPSAKCFVVADVIESRQTLRMVPEVGTIVSAHKTATSRAVLPFLTPSQHRTLAGGEIEPPESHYFEFVRTHGFAVSEGEINPAATNIAAPLFEISGAPIAAVVLTAPRERLPSRIHHALGKLIIQTTQQISRATNPNTVVHGS